MGAKKLKGIAVKGTQGIEAHDAEKMRELTKKWAKILKEHPATQDDMNYGTGEFYAWMNKERGTFPSRNWQWGYFQSSFDALKEGEKSHLDPYYWSPKYTVRHSPCPGCNKPCGRIIRIPEGKYAGTEIDGVEYEVLYSLGGMVDIDNIEAVAKANELCDIYGLDAISAGVTIAWAMEAYEKGLLTKDDTDGLELKFGSEDALLEAIKKMAYREGKLGALLADGVKRASEKLGKGSEKFALHIKGLEPPAYDIRGIKGMALAEAVSVRGACHLTAVTYALELVGKWWKFEGVDRLSAENKGFQIKTLEDIMTVYDALGVCKFSRHMFFIEGFLEIIEALTGRKMDLGELMLIGERIYNVAKAFNVREGFTRKDDSLPYRVTHEPIPKGVSAGAVVTEEELNHMLDEYYTARGWNREGIPTKAKLFTLGLEKIADEIGSGI